MLVVWKAPKGAAIRVRYEDVTLSPGSEFKRIGDFLGVEMDDLADMITNQEPLTIPPVLEGNRIPKERIKVRYDDS